jgi:Papain family cysteine protease
MPYAANFTTIDANPAANGHWATKSFHPFPDWEALLPPKSIAFDWRSHGLAPAVRNQGQWNACTSFALTAMVEARRVIRGSAIPRLSAGYVHYCRLGETNPDKGHNAPEVAAIASGSGIMPGAADGPPLNQAQCAIDPAQAVRVVGSGYVEPGAKALDLMASDGPLLVEVWLPDDFDTLRAHEVYRIAGAENLVLHSMMLVGYDWNAQTITMLGSNGTQWGNAGYVTMDMTEARFFGRWPFAVKV